MSANNNQLENRLWGAADELWAIEQENPDLKDVLPKTYNRLENATLVELLKLMGSIPMDIEGDAFGKIKEYQLCLPPEDLRERFTASSALTFQQIENLNLRNVTLRQTGDLLPKLISGELDVSKLDIDIRDAA